MVKMAAGESHASSRVASGSALGSCLVLFLYSLRASSKTTLKVEEDSVGMGGLEDELGVGY